MSSAFHRIMCFSKRFSEFPNYHGLDIPLARKIPVRLLTTSASKTSSELSNILYFKNVPLDKQPRNESIIGGNQPASDRHSLPKPKMDIDKTHVWASQVDWFATLTSASNGKGQRNFRRNSAVRLNWQSIDSNAPTRSNKFTNKFTNKIQQVHSHLKYQSEKTERLWIPVSRLAIFLIKWKYRQQHCSDDSLDTQIVVGVQCNTKMQLPANPTNGLTKPLRNWVDDHPL